MKTIVYFAVLVGLCMTSCSKSPEEKANVLIEKAVKATLFKPDTYEPVVTKVDSAFTPYCDPEFHKKLFRLKEIGESIYECDDKIRRAKIEASSAEFSMSIREDDNDSHSRHEYQRYKEQYEEHNRKIEEQTEKRNTLVEKGKKLREEIEAEIAKQPKFIGFKAGHRFRADNNAGETMMGDMFFVFDKDISEILLAYDAESEDYEAIDEMIQDLRDRQE